MANTKPDLTKRVFSYIEDHYKRWMDFAAYHCSRAGKGADLYQLMSDIQNEVLSLKTGTIARLIHTVSANFTELDFFVLRSIKVRIYES